MKNLKETHGLLFEFLLLGAVTPDAQHRFEETVVHVAVVCDFHIVEDGELAEEADVLECPRDAACRDFIRREPDDALATQGDLARRGAVDAREEVERRGLARAVRSDEPEQFALADVEVQVGDGGKPAEYHGDVRRLEQILGHHASPPFLKNRFSGRIAVTST